MCIRVSNKYRVTSPLIALGIQRKAGGDKNYDFLLKSVCRSLAILTQILMELNDANFSSGVQTAWYSGIQGKKVCSGKS